MKFSDSVLLKVVSAFLMGAGELTFLRCLKWKLVYLFEWTVYCNEMFHNNRVIRGMSVLNKQSGV